MTTIVLSNEARRAHAIKVISGLSLEELYAVEIAPYKQKRTNAQNARLWLLHTLAAEHVGCSALDMHEDMLCEFFGCNEVTLPTGAIRRVPNKRSSQRDKDEFRKFLDFVENFYIAKLGVFLGSGE